MHPIPLDSYCEPHRPGRRFQGNTTCTRTGNINMEFTLRRATNKAMSSPTPRWPPIQPDHQRPPAPTDAAAPVIQRRRRCIPRLPCPKQTDPGKARQRLLDRGPLIVATANCSTSTISGKSLVLCSSAFFEFPAFRFGHLRAFVALGSSLAASLPVRGNWQRSLPFQTLRPEPAISGTSGGKSAVGFSSTISVSSFAVPAKYRLGRRDGHYLLSVGMIQHRQVIRNPSEPDPQFHGLKCKFLLKRNLGHAADPVKRVGPMRRCFQTNKRTPASSVRLLVLSTCDKPRSVHRHFPPANQHLLEAVSFHGARICWARPKFGVFRDHHPLFNIPARTHGT